MSNPVIDFLFGNVRYRVLNVIHDGWSLEITILRPAGETWDINPEVRVSRQDVS